MSFKPLGDISVGTVGLLQECLCPSGWGITVRKHGPVCVPVPSNIIASLNNQADGVVKKAPTQIPNPDKTYKTSFTEPGNHTIQNADLRLGKEIWSYATIVQKLGELKKTNGSIKS